MIDPGSLRNQITLRQLVSDNDEGKPRVLASYLVRASIRGVNSREVERFGTVASEASSVATVRYTSNTARVGADWEVLWRARIYRVTGAVDPDGRGRTMRIYLRG